MNYLIIITIIVILISLFLSSKMRFTITRYIDDKINMDLYILPILNIRIDIDEYLNKKVKHKEMKKTINNIKELIVFIKTEEKLVKKFCKILEINDVRFAILYNYHNTLSIPLGTTIAWMLITRIQKLIINNFKKVENEKYEVILDDKKLDYKFLIDGNVRIFSLLWVIITNRKKIKKLYI